MIVTSILVILSIYMCGLFMIMYTCGYSPILYLDQITISSLSGLYLKQFRLAYVTKVMLNVDSDTILYKCDLENDYNFNWIVSWQIVSLLK